MDIKDCQASNNQLHFWHRARLILLKFLSQDLKENSKIISIGCGSGEELKILEKKGVVVGLDINHQAVFLARQQGFKTEIFNIQNACLSEKANAITAFDVLEHIENDQLALKNIYNSLLPGGYFLLTVPAYNWLFSSHDLALKHYRRYSQKEIKQKITETGFVIKKIGYWNFFLTPIIIVFRLIKKILKINNGLSEARTCPRFINYLGLSILNLENFLISRGLKFPWGISIYVVCQKN